MFSIQIKKITLFEISELQKISRTTFFETFSEANMEENITKYLEEDLSIEKLTKELENKNSDFYFGFLEEIVVGYLKLNFDQADKSILEIERIYVLKKYQRKNIGQQLLEYVIQLAKENKYTQIWLGVWEHNHNAIQFYNKNGFVAFDKYSFILGYDEQTDILMKLKLSEY